MITKLIFGALRVEFGRENRHRRFEGRFRADLAKRYPRLDGECVSDISNGLIAKAVYHPKHVEQKTGGDFGLMLARPEVKDTGRSLIIDMHSQGLMIQAKRQRPSGRLGSFTKSQLQHLPSCKDYTAFVLYMCEHDRARLAPFAWLRAHGTELKEIKLGFSKLTKFFPRSLAEITAKSRLAVESSSDIIQALAEGTCGTSNPSILAAHVCPDVVPNITIEITWPDRKPPALVQRVRRLEQVQARA